jgi:hypothetical protein
MQKIQNSFKIAHSHTHMYFKPMIVMSRTGEIIALTIFARALALLPLPIGCLA